MRSGERRGFKNSQARRVDARAGRGNIQHDPPPMVTTGENMRTMKRSPGSNSSGSLEQQAHIVARARRERFGTVEPADFGFHFGRAGVKMHGRAMLQRLGGRAAARKTQSMCEVA